MESELIGAGLCDGYSSRQRIADIGFNHFANGKRSLNRSCRAFQGALLQPNRVVHRACAQRIRLVKVSTTCIQPL